MIFTGGELFHIDPDDKRLITIGLDTDLSHHLKTGNRYYVLIFTIGENEDFTTLAELISYSTDDHVELECGMDADTEFMKSVCNNGEKLLIEIGGPYNKPSEQN